MRHGTGNTSILVAALVAAFLTSGARAAAAQSIQGTATLEGTRWRAVELAGKPTPTQDPKREAFVQFKAGRVTGSDGCNTISGSYQLKGDQVTFGQIIGTLMACPDASGTQGPFRDAVKNATRLTMAGNRLELFSAKGTRLAAFAAGAAPPVAAASPGLSGTTWHLVRFQGGDGKTLTPDDRASYRIEFNPSGQLMARFDCNLGQGAWRTSAPGQLEFGPLAITHVPCRPGSLHEQLSRQMGNVRSYVVRNGHLFLSLMADGGIYEWEPAPKK